MTAKNRNTVIPASATLQAQLAYQDEKTKDARHIAAYDTLLKARDHASAIKDMYPAQAASLLHTAAGVAMDLIG